MSSFIGCPGKECSTSDLRFDTECARRAYPECERLIDGLGRFFNHGIRPGHTLIAVLTNDLQGTFARADSTTVAVLPRLMELLYNHAPSGAYGSKRAFDEWRGETRTTE